ncbi:MAG: DUF5668 domain-containing protein [Candidatus Izemoplasmatales bacterium]|jgi:hypothetical protein|nr:DUF5668 domain-containing protein [Candidatus Izemoplasmatales bacterium]MDD5292890.1 DUF5668 domain-containing protein [Candidatus Izemoplasmatales bacterium]
MHNQRRIVGFLLIVFGVMFLLDKLDIFHFTLLINGWWTLLLIIPAGLSMARQGITAGNAILGVLGVYFLLEANGWNVRGFFIPAILIIFGLYIVLRNK